MRDLGIVFNYELRQQLGKRSVRVTTLILVIIALLATSIPRISAMFSSGGGDDKPAAANNTLVQDTGYVFADEAQRALYTTLLGLREGNDYATRDDLVAALKDKQLTAGFVFTGDADFEAVYQDKAMEDRRENMLSQIVAQHHRDVMLAEKGLTAQDLAAIEGFSPQITTTVMGKNTENNILLSMILMVVVYMLVLIYGNTTSTIIAREKDSKAMELLITSTKPTPLILGKVAAAGVSGVVQFSLIVLAALGGFLFSQDYYDPMIRQMLVGSLSQSYILTYLFFSITGYILYLFLYAALGSTVSRVEDVGSATAIVQFIFIAGYVASSFVMNAPGGSVAVATSLIPFTAIMVMPMRAGMSTVPAWQLLTAGVLMLLTVALFAWLSIKIYRWGSLNYGNKTNIFKVVREALGAGRRAKA
ncbi:MAG: ABC transporter permease [Clostridiales bacterium]|nr:ABC transporter permease [Clostridiales bacterium]